MASISFVSCGKDIVEEQNINVAIGANGKITLETGEIEYKIENRKLKKGESLNIDFSKTGADEENIALVLCWDDIEVGVIREFPSSFTYRMEKMGSHKLTIKQAVLHKDGSISISTSIVTDITVFVV